MTPDLLSGLNEQQYAAVTAGTGPVLVLAGPGSGKTRVLTRRVAFLVREMGVKPWEIMAVTFTNKAAGEMRHRVRRMLDDDIRGLQIGTFHSTCARLLRIEHEATPYRQDYVIYDSDDQTSLIGQVLEAENIDKKKFSPRAVLGSISKAKNELILPHEYEGDGYWGEVVRRCYVRYQDTLLNSNAMDFDDLLVQMVLLLRDNPFIREKYGERFPFLLVDEFQDTNMAQFELVKLVGQPQNNIFVVGDEDQSIYAFRGADYRNVLRFQDEYPNAQVILLEQNYRSTQTVLNVARAVIDHNQNRTPKALFTDRGDGTPIVVHEAFDEEAEAEFIVESIERMRRVGYRYADCAIMYRTNALSRPLEAAFRKHSVPYTLVGGVGFYGRREVRDMLAYLRVVVNPDDRVSFERVINTPRRGIGNKSLESFLSWALQDGGSIAGGLERLMKGDARGLSKRVAALFTEFAAQLDQWQRRAQPGQLATLFDQIQIDIDYTEYLYNKISDSDAEAKERSFNVQELRVLLVAADEDEIPLSEFIVEQALMTDVDTQREDEDADQVTLLTLHAAKGLEFPVVFITGVEEELLPHRMSFEEEEGIEEERRLFYVGITRARDHLVLTHTFRRSFYGGYGEERMASGFLRDIPTEYIDDSSSTTASDSWYREENEYQNMTRWPQVGGLDRLRRDLARKSGQEPQKPKNEKVRGKIIPFPGTQETKTQFSTGMQVKHAIFGSGTVIESKLDAGVELVTVAFQNKKHGIKELDADFLKSL